MNFKTTLVLLVLVIIGGVVWYFAGTRQPAAEEADTGVAPEPERRYVLDPRPENNDVVAVRIERADQPGLVFQRTPKKDDPERMEPWQMVEPLDSATETYMVDGLVTMLTGLQFRRSFQPGAAGAVTLTEAGLEPPAATITLIDKEGKEYGVAVGKPVALSNDMYVRVIGLEEIAIVGRDMTRDIDRKVNDYRAKAMMKLSANDARHVEITYEGQPYDFTRGADDEWVINEPVKAYALADKVKSLVTALGNVRVKEFVADTPESLSGYGLDAPMLTIRVTTEKQELVVEEAPEQAEQPEEPTTQPVEPRFETVTNVYALAVGDYADLRSEARYVKMREQPWVASATKQQIERLIPRLAELRDPRVTRVKAKDVTRLEIATGDQTAVLEKKGNKWHGTGDLAELERSAVDEILSAFEDVGAIDYIDDPQDLSQYGLEQPRVSLTVTTAGAVEPVSLRIGSDTPSGRNTYVQMAGQSSVVVINAQRAADLTAGPLSLRSRVITSGKPEQIRRLSVERADQRYALERPEDGKKWQMLEPADAPVDSASLREVLTDLSGLRARQVVARDADEAYGLDQPTLTIHFAMEQPIEAAPPETQPTTQATRPATQPAEPAAELVEHALRVSRRRGATYARFDDVPYVFELDQTVYDVLTQEVIQRGLFDVDAEDVTYLKIEAPGGTVEFAHDGEQWLYPPDRFVQLAQKKVGDFVKELAELRIKAYLAYRDGDLAEHRLENAPVTVTMRLKDESTITLKVGQIRPGELPRKAAWVEQQRIFILREGEAEKLMRELDYYVKPVPEADETSKPDAD